MTDKPIIFSAPMVRALLDGRKTQTRRVLKPQPDADAWGGGPPNCYPVNDGWVRFRFAPGDRLYVREAFSYDRLDVDHDGTLPPWYWADGNPDSGDWTRPKPSIHMPRWASRLTLIVTDVRVQRLRDISAADSIAEGIAPTANSLTIDCDTPNPRDSFRSLWNSIHGPDAWDANPWVSALTFTVHQRNIDQMPGVSHDQPL